MDKLKQRPKLASNSNVPLSDRTIRVACRSQHDEFTISGRWGNTPWRLAEPGLKLAA
jgi:hypothetical protein